MIELNCPNKCHGVRCCRCDRHRLIRVLRSNLFVILLVVGIAIGIILGVSLRYRPQPWSKQDISYLQFPGEMFMRMLQMVMIPLVVCSMVVGVSALEIKTSGIIGIRAVLYFLITTFVAVILGIILVAIIAPGNRNTSGELHGTGKPLASSTTDLFLDFLRNAIPNNVFAATFEKSKSVYTRKNETIESMTTPDPGSTVAPNVKLLESILITTTPGANLLGLIIFSIAFACALSIRSHIQETVGVVDFFKGCNEAILCLVRLILWFSPIGICFLFAAKIIAMENPLETLARLGIFMATVILALLIHGGIILPMIYFVIVRKNPFKYMHGCMEALIIAVSTASSSATLPIILRCVEERNRVHPSIARFLLPVGATINMNGTALFQAVAAIFIAQLNNKPLSVGDYFVICFTSAAAAIGAAGIPEAGLVTIAIVLNSIGMPVEDVSIILAFDWFLDRLRTTVNVWGDCVGAAVIERLSRKQLRKDDVDLPYEDADNLDVEAARSVSGVSNYSDGNTNPVFDGSRRSSEATRPSIKSNDNKRGEEGEGEKEETHSNKSNEKVKNENGRLGRGEELEMNEIRV